jgi:hypothetical protein
MMNKICSNCGFFQFDKDQRGFCKRYPPTLVGDVFGCWPRVKAIELACGEWRNKDLTSTFVNMINEEQNG